MGVVKKQFAKVTKRKSIDAENMEYWAMAQPMDVTFHNIHGFCHGTMGKPITWQNPYTMTFAMVYGLCHRSMAKPMGYPNPAQTRGVIASAFGSSPLQALTQITEKQQ